MRVAFQGGPGAFSESAARQALGDGIETLPCRTFLEVAIAGGAGDAGALDAAAERGDAGRERDRLAGAGEPLERGDPRADDRLDAAAHGFDFGKFGHVKN